MKRLTRRFIINSLDGLSLSEAIRYERYYINDISILKFEDCSLLFDTYHGTIISTSSEQLCSEFENKFNLQRYDNINEHKITNNLKPEYLFDEIGNLNIKIKNYGIKTGLDIRSTSTSLKLRISNMSNDYSYLEYYYKYVVNHDLLSTTSFYKKKYSIKNISIIIPVYNQNVKDKTSFETSDNDEKFPTGPTTFIPGPTLFKHVATAEKALAKSIL